MRRRGMGIALVVGGFFIDHRTNPTLYRKLPYDTLRDFAPVVPIADGPLAASRITERH